MLSPSAAVSYTHLDVYKRQGLRGFDVDPVRVVVAAGDVADTDDLRAGFLEEEGVVGPDLSLIHIFISVSQIEPWANEILQI